MNDRRAYNAECRTILITIVIMNNNTTHPVCVPQSEMPIVAVSGLIFSGRATLRVSSAQQLHSTWEAGVHIRRQFSTSAPNILTIPLHYTLSFLAAALAEFILQKPLNHAEAKSIISKSGC